MAFTIATAAGLFATAPVAVGGDITFQVAVPGDPNQHWNFINGLPAVGPIQNVGTGTFATVAAVAPGQHVITAVAPFNWQAVNVGGNVFNIVAPGTPLGWTDAGPPAHDAVLGAPPAPLTINAV